MKNTELIALALAGVAVYMIVKGKKTTAVTSADGPPAGAATEIFNDLGKSFANGWKYFTDGTAIDPAGSYYSDGQLIWSPAK